ncbi:MAG: GNAT family N-acetyltransferase [Anaerolineae bacterium]|nr:GNAT family N-acetyltransferase [Anaerolineae bacterium]
MNNSRTYSGPHDLESMLDLLLRARPASRIADFPAPVDLREALALRAVQENTRLWFQANGELVAFAYVDPYQNLRWEVDRRAAPPKVEPEIVGWGVECIRRAMRESGKPLALEASCREDDAERMAMLGRHGFERQAERTLHLARSLHEPIPEPRVPAGFLIRPVVGEEEAPALVALHRAAFGTEQMTLEERLAMMRVPGYDPDLDLLVTAPDGRLAAYCICSIDQEENECTGRNEGYTDPVATHPEFRRRGLARALLWAGLAVLKQRGIDVALLGTSSENVAMQRVAQSVGFRVQSASICFSRPVSPDQEAR